uniref:Plant heme peroxidase family profile domain-containing protein n=1 Tax=Aegilops tauschii subsp. strangulata TaxID=200361 RepID=A0A453EBI8_AEGTS
MLASEIATVFFLFNVLLRSSLVHSQGLQRGFYDSSCPDAEDIVRSTVEKYYNNDATIAPGLLRLHFHDCFVQVSSIILFCVACSSIILLFIYSESHVKLFFPFCNRFCF